MECSKYQELSMAKKQSSVSRTAELASITPQLHNMTIKTYLKFDKNTVIKDLQQVDTHLALIDDLQPNIVNLDFDYIEGALELHDDYEVQVIFKEQYDLIDTLIAYFLSAIEEYSHTGSARFSFPDMPLEVTFIKISTLQVLIKVGDRQGTFNFVNFRRDFAEHAKYVYTKLVKFLGGNNPYQHEFNQIKRLRSK